MNRTDCLGLAALVVATSAASCLAQPPAPTVSLPIAAGPFEPTWESLQQYE